MGSNAAPASWGATSRARATSGASAGKGKVGKSRQKRFASNTPVWPARKTTTLSWGLFLDLRGHLVEGVLDVLGGHLLVGEEDPHPGFAGRVEAAGVQHLADPRRVAPGVLELARSSCRPRLPGRPRGAGRVHRPVVLDLHGLGDAAIDALAAGHHGEAIGPLHQPGLDRDCRGLLRSSSPVAIGRSLW